MLLDLVICECIFLTGQEVFYLPYDESGGLWCVCAVPTPAGARGQAMEWMLCGVVGRVCRIVVQTEL